MCRDTTSLYCIGGFVTGIIPSSAACLSWFCLLECSQSLGLHCISASVEVGNTVLTASKALLSALATLAAISRQSKAASAGAAGGQPIRKKSRSKVLTTSAFDKIVATLPDQVGSKNTCGKFHEVLCDACERPCADAREKARDLDHQHNKSSACS